MARILVLDDDPLIGMMLAEWLQELGHEVLGPAQTEAEAFALVDGGRIDAALLDLQLGNGADGYGVAARLRSRGICFAFATGHGRDGLLEEFRDCQLLAKPFDWETVEGLLKEWFGAEDGTGSPSRPPVERPEPRSFPGYKSR